MDRCSGEVGWNTERDVKNKTRNVQKIVLNGGEVLSVIRYRSGCNRNVASVDIERVMGEECLRSRVLNFCFAAFGCQSKNRVN